MKARNLERAGHGLYRLAAVPVSELHDLVRLSFWSRGRSDEPLAVVSHASALVLHGLTDLLPGTIHLTVRGRFQKKPPRGCTLHRAKLGDDEVEGREGFRVTTPLRTLLDVAGSPDVPEDEHAGAVRVALERGLVRRGALVEAARSARGSARLARVLGVGAEMRARRDADLALHGRTPGRS